MPERASYTCPKCRAVSYHPQDIENLYCGHCHLFAEQLRDEPVTQFQDVCNLSLTHRDCFTLAALTLFHQCQDPAARLVHAWTRDSWRPSRYIEHAWCETPAIATLEDGSTVDTTVVVDYTQLDERMTILPQAMFYEKLHVRDDLPPKRYTREEMIAAAIKFGHDGPWRDEKFDLPADLG